MLPCGLAATIIKQGAQVSEYKEKKVLEVLTNGHLEVSARCVAGESEVSKEGSREAAGSPRTKAIAGHW